MEELKDLIRNQVQFGNRLLEREAEMFDRMIKISEDHEKRLRVLERGAAYAAGAVGLGLFFYKTFVK